MSVYNGGAPLRAALDSVLAQEGVDFELVAVDDGSTDDSGAFLEERAAHDDRLRVIRQPNSGLTQALIRGCAEARGEFIARQDADDVSLPGRLARQANAMAADSALAMVSCWTRAVAPGGELLWTIRRVTNPAEATRRLLNEREGPPCHGSVMFRRASYEAVGGYRPQFWFAQDSDLWLRLSEVGLFLCIPEVLYLFTVGEGSISSTHRHMQNQFGELGHACRHCRVRGESEDVPLREAARLAERVAGARGRRGGRKGAAAYMIGRWLLREGSPAAGRYLARAVEREPWNVKAWISLIQARGLVDQGSDKTGD